MIKRKIRTTTKGKDDHETNEVRLMKIRDAVRMSALSRPEIYARIKQQAFRAIFYKGTASKGSGVWLVDRADFLRWLDAMSGTGAEHVQMLKETYEQRKEKHLDQAMKAQRARAAKRSREAAAK